MLMTSGPSSVVVLAARPRLYLVAMVMSAEGCVLVCAVAGTDSEEDRVPLSRNHTHTDGRWRYTLWHEHTHSCRKYTDGHVRRHISRFHAGHYRAFMLTAPVSKVTNRDSVLWDLKLNATHFSKNEKSASNSDRFIFVHEWQTVFAYRISRLAACSAVAAGKSGG